MYATVHVGDSESVPLVAHDMSWKLGSVTIDQANCNNLICDMEPVRAQLPEAQAGEVDQEVKSVIDDSTMELNRALSTEARVGRGAAVADLG